MWFLNIESESWLCSTSLTLNRTYRDILVNSHILSWKQYMISSINDSMFLSSCVCVGGMLMNLCIAFSHTTSVNTTSFHHSVWHYVL